MDEIYEDGKIHATADIDPTVIMGKGNIICEGVIIRAGVQLGDNNYVGPYCIIGDYPEKIGFFDKLGRVIIGNNNRFTKQVTIDSSTDKQTVIGNDTKFLKNSHVGHDAHISDGVILSCNVCIGGHTMVGPGANFGLGAVVHQRMYIPSNVMIGMNATVTKKTVLLPNRKYAGTPARDIGPNVK